MPTEISAGCSINRAHGHQSHIKTCFSHRAFLLSLFHEKERKTTSAPFTSDKHPRMFFTSQKNQHYSLFTSIAHITGEQLQLLLFCVVIAHRVWSFHTALECTTGVYYFTAFLDHQGGLSEVTAGSQALLASELVGILIVRASTALLLVVTLGDVSVVIHLLVAEQHTIIVTESTAGAVQDHLCRVQRAAAHGAQAGEHVLALLASDQAPLTARLVGAKRDIGSIGLSRGRRTSGTHTHCDRRNHDGDLKNSPRLHLRPYSSFFFSFVSVSTHSPATEQKNR